MKWFIDAAKKLQAKGVKEISVVSETITTHEYESKTLAKAFEEITGIKVKHDIIQEGDVVEKLQTSMQSGKSIYDGWITDSDLIGTHYRYGKILALTDYMAGAGKEYTNPGLDLKDFIGTSFTTAPDGKLYQLPDQQFANLYWFRADLFARQDLKDKFKAKYGYDLGVPLNWSAYEDIAEFFTNDVKTIDGKPIYGHMDYGKKDPSLGWRFTDAWLSMAGTADIGIPNGMPVDEWGIRVAADKCTPVGASVSRGGATNSPAAVYALTKYVDWMKKYAPKEATGMTFGEAGPVPAQGQIAQQIFWYTAFTADMTKAGLPVVNADGTPKWRMAPGPNGPYWKQGMQNGYQDVGSWTFFKDHDANKTAAAWLYAQFITAKTVSAEEVDRRPDVHPRQRHPARLLHPERGQVRRPDRVLSQPGARRVDADRHQRSRLSEAGAALVEERRRRRHRREDAAGGDGHARRRDGPGDGPPRARRHGALRAQAQPQGRPGQVAERQGRAVEEAGQREAEGRDDRLRDAAERLEGRQGALALGAVGGAPRLEDSGCGALLSWRRSARVSRGRATPRGSAEQRRVGQLVDVDVARPRREVAHEQRVDGVDRAQQAGLEVAGLERALHRRRDLRPLGRRDDAVQAAIGDDLDRALGEQQIDQDAVVALGVPDAELAEQRDGAVARRRVAAQVAERQAGLDDDADLAAVALLARGDARLDARQRVLAEQAARIALVEQAVLERGERASAPSPPPRGAAAVEVAAAARAEAAAAAAAAKPPPPKPPPPPPQITGPSQAAAASRRGPSRRREEGDDAGAGGDEQARGQEPADRADRARRCRGRRASCP